jgi:hypothetical protein
MFSFLTGNRLLPGLEMWLDLKEIDWQTFTSTMHLTYSILHVQVNCSGLEI